MLDRIALILPIRYAGEERKKRLKNAINSWHRQSEGLSDLHVIIDNDNIEEFDFLYSVKEIESITVQSAENTLMQKLNTIALDIASNYKYMAFTADDIIFETPWESRFIDYLKSVPYGVVYANDTIHGENLPTHPCVSSNLVTALGFFGCPAVSHNYFDNFWMSIGTELGYIKYFDDVIMRHIHPLAGRAPLDELSFKVFYSMNSDGDGYAEYMSKNFAEDIEKIKRMDA
jgi:predicted protein tyrosine phosphatase